MRLNRPIQNLLTDMHLCKIKCLLWIPLLFCLIVFLPQDLLSSELNDFQRCMVQAMETADSSVTLDELRQRCLQRIKRKTETDADPSSDAEKKLYRGVVERRLAKEKEHILKPYLLMAHRPNYFLVASYNASGVNAEPFREQFDDPDIDTDDTEAKFQMSVKTPVLISLFNDRVDVFAAYTNRSFWQVYNKDASAPFRETNHELELWFQIHNDWQLFGFENKLNALGIGHQSNGRGGILSRSWNRIYANFIFQHHNWVFSFMPWYRIPEDDKEDDNPDITDYMGHFQLGGAYKWGEHTFSLMLRNNLESNFEKGAFELDWSFPLWNYPFIKGYVQYFNGYGESLIDYNQRSNSIGIGILLTDWL